MPSASVLLLEMENDVRLTQNAHVISATLLGFLNNGCQCVREVLEHGVLLLDLHPQNTVQELPHVVVVCSRNKRHGLLHKPVPAGHQSSALETDVSSSKLCNH